MLHRIKKITPLVRRTAASVEVKPPTAEAPSKVDPPTTASIAPPRRRHRDAVSVLRALSSCVTPHLGLPAYGCALEPWLGAPGIRERSSRLAAAAGRNAARHVARNLLANDLTALATEVSFI